MASEITHVVLGKKLFDRHFRDRNEKEFFLGTVFPDIRYISDLRRKETHLTDVTLEEVVQEKEAFFVGFKTHSLVDWARMRFIYRHPSLFKTVKDVLNLEDEISSLPRRKRINLSYALKFLEDEVLYPKIKDWQKYIHFLDQILPQERSFGLPEETIKRWHLMLQDYFSQKPNEGIRRKYCRAMGFSQEAIEEENRLIKKIKSDKRLCRLPEELYLQLEDFISPR